LTGVWGIAQTNTNTTAKTAKPAPRLFNDVERLQGHYLTFWLDRIPVLQERTFLEQPLWKYGASLIYILLAFYVSKLIDYVTRVWLKRLADRTHTKVDDVLLELLEGPVKIIVFVVFLNLGLNIFEWPPRVKLYLTKGLVIVVAAALTYLAIKNRATN
jgi:MscS family membrane protein